MPRCVEMRPGRMDRPGIAASVASRASWIAAAIVLAWGLMAAPPARATLSTDIFFTEFSWTYDTVDPVLCEVDSMEAHCVYNALTITANSGMGDSSFLAVEIGFSFTDDGSPAPNLADPFMLYLPAIGTYTAGYDDFQGTTGMFLVGYDRDLIGMYTGTINMAYVCTGEILGDGVSNCTMAAVSGVTSGTFRVVPEPATLAIFAFGLVGLGFMTRRRRREAVAA